MITVIVAAIVVVIALLQSTWLSGLYLLGARPDLVLIVLTYHSYRVGAQKGQITGFVLGFVEDGLSVSPPGFFAVVRLLHSAFVGSTRRSITSDTIITPVTLAALAFTIKTAAILVIASILQLDQVIAGVFSVETLLEGIYTIVLAPPCFWVLRKSLDRFVRRLR